MRANGSKTVFGLALGLVLAVLAPTAVLSQEASAFYAGKTVSFVVGQPWRGL